MTDIFYSLIIPTYKRPDVLALCLNNISQLDYPLDRIEVLIYDNGSPQDSKCAAEPYFDRLNITYKVNEPGHGPGYSLRLGELDSCGHRIVELNDDALMPQDILRRFDDVFNSDPRIGIIGVRAIEDQYVSFGSGIGTFDVKSAAVIGNFNQTSENIIDVDHVYGFCYAYSRKLLNRGGGHDSVMLTKDYCSGNRLETDHCLTAKRLGFRVVYDGRIGVRHLAKPRTDISENSPRWRLNHIRNTLYLYLKHFGLFGKSFLALRFAFLTDVGIISALKHPAKSNWMYFYIGMRARFSAFAHYILYLFYAVSSFPAGKPR